MSRRRVLLVSYHFPPVGGAGVQRPAKFARYLPEFGWDVTVLTCANATAPVRDSSLVTTLAKGSTTLSVRSWEPAAAVAALNPRALQSEPARWRRATRKAILSAARAVLQPDPQVLWHLPAYRAIRKHLAAVPHHAVLATAPPFSSLLLGARIARRTGLPFIADFRDEWEISQAHIETASRGALSRTVQRRMQRSVLAASDTVVATTAASTNALAVRAQEAGASPRAVCIYNGWDPDDFLQARPDRASPPDRWRLVYTGTLWNLTDVGPLAEALTALQQRAPEVAANLEFAVIGRKTEEQERKLTALASAGVRVRSEPYAPHDEVVHAMRSGDAVLLLLAHVEEAARVIPGKLFEYMGSGTPILAICPDGETASLVRQAGGTWFAPEETGAIARWIEGQVRAAASAREVGHPDRSFIDQFSRRNQAQRLAAALTAAADGTATNCQ